MKTWTVVHMPKKRGDGHKIYRDETGRLAVADWSGGSPSTTEDGPLYIPPGELTIGVDLPPGRGLCITLPLRTEDGKHTRTLANVETIAALRVAGVPMRFSIAGGLHDLIDVMGNDINERGKI